MAHLPACCSNFREHWPLPLAADGLRLVSGDFDPGLLQPGDFPRCAIDAPPGVAKRQAEFLAGRLCARAALDAIGRPGLPGVGADRAPRWPDGSCGSITHSHGKAAAVAGPNERWRGVGIDLERPLAASRAERLAGEILTAEELRRLPASAEQRAMLISLTFSIKESLFKALYPLVGQRFYFEHAELLHSSPQGTARLRLLIDLSEEWHAGRELDGQFCLFDDHLLSLVAIAAAH